MPESWLYSTRTPEELVALADQFSGCANCDHGNHPNHDGGHGWYCCICGESFIPLAR